MASSTGVYCPGLRCFDESDFEVQRKLGEGSYGAVHRVRTNCGLWMAVKKVGVDWFDYGLPPSTMREVSLLTKLKGLLFFSLLLCRNERTFFETHQVTPTLLISSVLFAVTIIMAGFTYASNSVMQT
eukprot:TRINITY_DN1570_c2_g1_i2.p1 TRINITY_DN1570_c2_g1~~TRINITY_DN1570_c2_g1_i2.p1  ORF type:complete len:127 (+),score=12.02 TRINITY_DN1570_c2_g1_i2:189-569(+)